MKKAISLVYLHNSVMADDFNYLHRYLHSGIFHKDNRAAFLCRDIETANPYLTLTLAAPSEVKGVTVHIQHSLVVVILDLASRDTQLGFLDSA